MLTKHRLRLLTLVAIAALAASVGGTARATVIECVGNSDALNDALLAAALRADSTGEGTEIKVRRSDVVTYLVTDLPVSQQTGKYTYTSLSLLGGYAENGPCDEASRVIRAQDTRLTFNLAASSFNALFVAQELLTIEGFAINTNKPIKVVVGGQSTSSARIANNKVTGSSAQLLTLWRDNTATGDIIFSIVNNLFTHPGVGTQTSCAVELLDLYSGTTNGQITNNTIAANVTRGVCLSEIDETRFDNNIIFDNVGGGIVASGSSVILVNNLLQQTGNSYDESFEGGTIATSPQFVGNGNFRLAALSPAVNTGWNHPSVALKDLDGAPRRYEGSLPDLGAYELQGNSAPLIKVTSKADSGPGSLRRAIEDANGATNTPQRIEFAIPGSCPQVITLSLPIDIYDALTIDGSTQPLSRRNTGTVGTNAAPCIVIQGPGLVHGLRVPANVSDTMSLEVSDIYFTGFSSQGVGTAIRLEGGRGHRIVGNLFVKNPPSVPFSNASNTGVVIGTNARFVRIGGKTAAERNVFSGGSKAGVQIGGDYNVVENNLIGAGESGYGGTDTPNALGVDLLSSATDNLIEGNTISNNSGSGVYDAGDRNRIERNLIGTTDRKSCAGSPCSIALPNNVGISVDTTAIGSFVARNQILFNSTAGIFVQNGATSAITANAFDSNGKLAIDLAPLGVNENDVDGTAAASTQGNRGQNFPILSMAGGLDDFGGNGLVKGRLETSPAGNYTIEVYASVEGDQLGHGEGYALVGSKTVAVPTAPSGSNGGVDFEIPIAGSCLITGLNGCKISALARGPYGSSEFSPWITFVTTTDGPPSIAPQTFFVPEDTAPGATIENIVAADEGPVAYSAPGAAPTFAVAANGTLSLDGQATLDYETQTSYVFDVTVTDQGNPPQSATATITVQVTNVSEPGDTDQPPSIAAQTYSVQVDDDGTGYEQDRPFATVLASDPEGPVKFEITNPGQLFAIDENTGALSLLGDPDFALPSYQVNVRVRDTAGADATAPISVIDDVLKSDGFECKTIFPDCN